MYQTLVRVFHHMFKYLDDETLSFVFDILLNNANGLEIRLKKENISCSAPSHGMEGREADPRTPGLVARRGTLAK